MGRCYAHVQCQACFSSLLQAAPLPHILWLEGAWILVLTSTVINILDGNVSTALPSEKGHPDAGSVHIGPLLTWLCWYTSLSLGDDGSLASLSDCYWDHCLLSLMRRMVLVLSQSVLRSIRKERSWHDSCVGNNQTRYWRTKTVLLKKNKTKQKKNSPLCELSQIFPLCNINYEFVYFYFVLSYLGLTSATPWLKVFL